MKRVAWLAALCVSLVIGPLHGGQEAEAFFERGLQAAQRGDATAAESELRQAVTLAPQHHDALAALGAVLGMQGKLEESNAYLEKALSIDPSDSGTRRNLASNQFQLGQTADARVNLQQLLRQQPDDPQATLLLGMVSEELRDDRTALRLLEAAPELVEQRPESLIALARVRYRLGKTREAETALRKLDAYRSRPQAVFLGAEAALGARDWPEAERMFRSIAETYPDRSKVAQRLALAQYRGGHPVEARKTLTRLLADGQESAEAFNLLAWCFFREGNVKDAVASLDLAIDREPNNASHYIDVGLMLFGDKRYSASLEAANRAVKADPNSYRARMLAGLVDSRLNRPDEALAAYQVATKLKPEAPEPLLATAIVLSTVNREQQAEQMFRAAIKRFPKQPMIAQEYGKFLLRVSSGQAGPKQVEAKRMLETALSLDANLADAHYELGKLALDEGRVEDALKHLERTADRAPDAARTHFLLARAYRAAGRDSDAARETARFQELRRRDGAHSQSDPENPSSDETERSLVLTLEP